MKLQTPRTLDRATGMCQRHFPTQSKDVRFLSLQWSNQPISTQFLGSPWVPNTQNPPNITKPSKAHGQFPAIATMAAKSRYHRGSSPCRGHRAPHSEHREAVHNRSPFPPASWPGLIVSMLTVLIERWQRSLEIS